MSRLSSSSERIVVVGGGFAGLSAAARLAQAGLPVTVLEASKLGYAASSRNQGWLHSGAWFAKTHPELARKCFSSLQQTIAFSPDCLEPGLESMVYLSLDGQSDLETWTEAWDQVGIPYQTLNPAQLDWDLPGLTRDRISWAMRLPDRSFRPDVLLGQLAATARNAGAEIRPETVVTGLLCEDRRVYGVAVGANEEIRAKLVILATGASRPQVLSQLFHPESGRQSDYQLIWLKYHLRALRPGIDADPFCAVDGVGLNHLPHDSTSVFGTNHWQIVPSADSNQVDADEVTRIERELSRLFPDGFGTDVEVTDWAGTTVQAMHPDQIEPAVAPLPTIVDHSREPCGIENVLSIFPGRATLWADLAESVRTTVLEHMGSRPTEVRKPPWTATS